MKKVAWYWLPVIALALLIFWQSSRPVPPQTPEFWASDKLAHIIVYALLGFLCHRAITNSLPSWPTRAQLILSTTLAVLYGLSDELHQALVPQRSADVLDWIADSLGALIGVWLCHRLAKRRKRALSFTQH